MMTQEENIKASYQEGYDEGYSDGFSYGKEKGYAEAMKEMYFIIKPFMSIEEWVDKVNAAREKKK